MTRLRMICRAAVLAVSCAGFPVSAADRGPVTNLPLPRYVSMKAAEGFVRRGPSKTHRIDWVYKQRDMPLQVIAEHEHWRRVRDRDGAGGWMHYTLLSGARTVLIEQDLLPLYDKPDEKAPIAARLQLGVVARLDKCDFDWCHLQAGGYDGWAHKTALWGVAPDEIIK